MPFQDVFVHGAAASAHRVGDAYLKNFEFDDEGEHVIVDWSNIVGFDRGRDRIFVGRGGTFNSFGFSLSMPVLVGPDPGTRPKCQFVSVVADLESNAAVIYAVSAFAGQQTYHTWPSQDQPQVLSITGDQTTQWRRNFTFFEVPAAKQRDVMGPLNVVAHCRFDRDGFVRFVGAGARLLLP